MTMPVAGQKKPKLNPAERAILNEIQSHFPLLSRPYREVARRLGLPEGEVVRQVQALRDRGIIRRIGANFNSRKLGFTSTLCAARVPKEKMEGFIEVVNAYSGVTHNYERPGDYNVWFTLIAESREKIMRSLEEIKRRTGIRDLLNLPALKIFKIRVDFEV
jgi:DNA-binding Lrp family transcriptional regulator